jgi:hypothetical protein
MACFQRNVLVHSMFATQLKLQKHFTFDIAFFELIFCIAYFSFYEVYLLYKNGSSKASNLMGSKISRGGDYETILVILILMLQWPWLHL